MSRRAFPGLPAHGPPSRERERPHLPGMGRDSAWPGLVADSTAAALLQAWADRLALLGAWARDAQDAVAVGPGHAEVRTRQRGGDPVAGRVGPGRAWPCDGCPYAEQGGCDDATCAQAGQPRAGPVWQRPPAPADLDLQAIRRLRARALDALRYDLDRLDEAMGRPFERQGLDHYTLDDREAR